MKTLVLVLALMAVVGGAAVAETVTFDIYQGWNMMALPQAPFDPAATTVLKTTAGTSLPLYYNLSYFDGFSGSDFTYTEDTESFYPGLMLGQGYWLNYNGAVDPDTGAATIQYTGFPNGLKDSESAPCTDMWISLPGGDFDGDGVPESGTWNMVGNPFNQFVDVGVGGANIKFTDGQTVKTWSEASTGATPWVSPLMFGFSGGSDVTVGYGSDNLNFLIPSFGYWLQTYRPNIAMIVDGNKIYSFE